MSPDASPRIPGYWAADVVLSDGGTVHLRPRRDDDHDAIVDLYAHMSDHSRYLRFAGPTTSDRAGDLESKATVDLDHHFSVVAELGERLRSFEASVRSGKAPSAGAATSRIAIDPQLEKAVQILRDKLSVTAGA